MGRSILAVAVLVVVAVVVGFLALGGGGKRPESEERAPREPPPPSERTEADEPSEGTDEVTETSGPCGIRGTVFLGRVPTPARVEIAWTSEQDGWARDPAQPSTVLSADARGRFELPGLRAGHYMVRATVGGMSGVVRTYVWEREPWATVALELPGGDLHLVGRAVHVDGRPFRGEVIALPVDVWGGGRTRLPAIPTGEDGRFEIPGLAPGPVRLVARIPGRLEIVGPAWRVPAKEEITFVVDGGLTPIDGRVVAAEDGTPVAGATILASRDPGEASSLGVRWSIGLRLRSDPDGRFSIYRELLPAGVTADGFAGAYALAPEEGEELVVRLHPPSGRKRPMSFARGAVLDTAGAPVAGAVVRWQRATATSAPDGSYEVRIASRGHLRVQGGGWVSRELHTHRGLALDGLAVSVKPGETLARDLVAIRAARVRGRVVDESGDPVAGISVEIGWAEYPPRERYEWRSVHEASAGAATTDEDGRFLLADVIPGIPHSVRLVGPGRGTHARTTVRGEPDETIEVELVQPALRRAEVLVVFADTEEPVAGALVIPDGGDRVRTDLEGRAVLGPLPPGEAAVTVHRPDIVDHRAPLTAEGPTRIAVERGHVLGGVVLDPEGRPVPSAQVYVGGSGRGRDFEREQYTTADGLFLFTGLLEEIDELTISASLHDGARTLHAHLSPRIDDREIVLRLAVWEPRAQSLYEVEVVDTDGEPVVGGRRIRWSGTSSMPGRRIDEGWLGRGGKFVLGAAAKRETVWIEIFAARSEDGPLAPVLHGPLKERFGPVRITLPKPTSVSGKVVGPDGRPVAGAEVAAVPGWPERGIRRPPHAETTTAQDGTFELVGLADAPYELVVKAPEPCASPAPVSVRGGATGVRIELARAADVTIRVLDADGEPAEGATVSLFRDGSKRFEGRTDQRGAIRPRDLDPQATLTLTVWLNGHIRQTVKDWRPEDRTVRMERDFPIRGVVRDSGGKARARVKVLFRPRGRESWRSAWSGRDGTFVLWWVPAGAVEIRVGDLPTVTVEAGSTDVVLRVPGE
jgi:protocatechuate 3,4-dioxygenase beta subunit